MDDLATQRVTRKSLQTGKPYWNGNIGGQCFFVKKIGAGTKKIGAGTKLR